MSARPVAAAELARAIGDRVLSSREVVRGYLDRIEAHNPRLNAIVTLDAERALERAGRADEALARGEKWGPLHGVPFTLKDGHSTGGVRTTVGAQELAEFVPEKDGAVAARLKAAGAILLGKTNVPPFLMSAQTLRAHQQPVEPRAHPRRLQRRSRGGRCRVAHRVRHRK